MNKRELVQEVRCEVGQLEGVAEMASALSRLPAADRRPWDASAAAKYVADLVLGLENLCRRRYKWLGQLEPAGPESHMRMLDDFLGDPALGGRLPDPFVLRLKKYMRFRHRFFHGYGHQVHWDIVEEPLALLPDTVRVLGALWTNWADETPDKG